MVPQNVPHIRPHGGYPRFYNYPFLMVAPLPPLILPWDRFVNVLPLCVIRPLLLKDVCPKLLLECNTSSFSDVFNNSSLNSKVRTSSFVRAKFFTVKLY